VSWHRGIHAGSIPLPLLKHQLAKKGPEGRGKKQQNGQSAFPEIYLALYMTGPLIQVFQSRRHLKQLLSNALYKSF
jgi:hypothetical protein